MLARACGVCFESLSRSKSLRLICGNSLAKSLAIRGGLRAWDQGIWSEGILLSFLVPFFRRFKLLRQLLRRAPGADQLDHLATEFRWVGWSRLRHRGLLEHKSSGVHETGSTPQGLHCAGRPD